MKLLLASSSPYRRALLARLGLPFQSVSPRVLEEAIQGEDPPAVIQARARAKAREVWERHPDALVIGSDQGLIWEGKLWGKPLERKRAAGQLQKLQGATHQLLTAVSLQGLGIEEHWSVTADMTMAPLTDRQIEDYLTLDEPYDCAGSYRFEAHGISLFDTIDCPDESTIVGLPLLSLGQRLRSFYLQRQTE